MNQTSKMRFSWQRFYLRFGRALGSPIKIGTLQVYTGKEWNNTPVFLLIGRGTFSLVYAGTFCISE